MPITPCQKKSARFVNSEKKPQLSAHLYNTIMGNDDIIRRQYNISFKLTSKFSENELATKKMTEYQFPNLSLDKKIINNKKLTVDNSTLKSEPICGGLKSKDRDKCYHYFNDIMRYRDRTIKAYQLIPKGDFGVKFCKTEKTIPFLDVFLAHCEIDEITLRPSICVDFFDRDSNFRMSLEIVRNSETNQTKYYANDINCRSLQLKGKLIYPIVPNNNYDNSMPTGGDITIGENQDFLLSIFYTEFLITNSNSPFQRTYSGSVAIPFTGKKSKHRAYFGNFGYCDGINVLVSHHQLPDGWRRNFLQNAQVKSSESFLALSHMYNLRKLVGKSVLPTVDRIHRSPKMIEKNSLGEIIMRRPDSDSSFSDFERSLESINSVDFTLIKDFIKRMGQDFLETI